MTGDAVGGEMFDALGTRRGYRGFSAVNEVCGNGFLRTEGEQEGAQSYQGRFQEISLPWIREVWKAFKGRFEREAKAYGSVRADA